MDGLLYSKAQLLIVGGIFVGVGIDVDEGEEKVGLAVGRGEDGDDFEGGYQEEEPYQEVLVLHEGEYPGLSAGYVYLVGIGQSETAHEVEEVETAVEGVEDGPVYVLEAAPVPGEVVIGVGEGVHDELDGHAGYHENAEHGGPFLHGVVVLEDEPFRPYPHTDGQDQQHPADRYIHFGVDCGVGLVLDPSQVVLAPAE